MGFHKSAYHAPPPVGWALWTIYTYCHCKKAEPLLTLPFINWILCYLVNVLNLPFQAHLLQNVCISFVILGISCGSSALSKTTFFPKVVNS